MQVKDVTTCVFMKPPAELMTVDFEHLSAMHKATVAQRETLNPPEPEPTRAEYNRLRQQFYDLRQQAKNAEVHCNNKADEVKGLEERINDLLRKKKHAVAEGHLGQERLCEHQLQQLEKELVDVKDEFSKAKHWSTQAARALKAFEGHERIAVLKAELETPKIISK